MAMCLLTGCSSLITPDVKLGSATFDHPDEIQQGEGFLVLADRRIFATMAFLNAAGYDKEQPDTQMHPVRVKVRQWVAESLRDHPGKHAAWRKYYQKHRFGMFYYKAFALSLSTDYPFERIVPNALLGYPSAARELKALPAILNDFWITAQIEQIWQKVKNDYLEEIHRFDLDKMDRQMTFLWEYLRLERKDLFIIVQIPDLLDHHRGAMGAGYGGYFYSVDNPGGGSYALNVHEYLHTIVNPLVERHHFNYEAKLDAYYQAAKGAPDIQSYQHPVTFVYECLVGALSRRIRERFEGSEEWTRIIKWQISDATRKGLNLTQPFYDLLSDYEQGDMSFDEFLPSMLERLPEYRGS